MEIVEDGDGSFFVTQIRMNVFDVFNYIQSCNMSGTFVALRQVEAAHNGQLKDALDGFNKASRLMSSEIVKNKLYHW